MGAVFLGSFVTAQKLPQQHGPQIAFLGRSNVGKSSLINLLAGSRIARVSKTPGRTRTLNLFRIDDRCTFGDFPGYGFARVSKQERKEWKTLIETFLKPKYFDFAIQIVDARHPGLDLDLQLQEWLNHNELPNLIVLNKADQLNQKERVEAGRKAREAFAGRSLLFASTVNEEGKREMETILRKLTTSATRNASLSLE